MILDFIFHKIVLYDIDKVKIYVHKKYIAYKI